MSRTKITQNPEDLIYELAGYDNDDSLRQDLDENGQLSSKDSLSILRATLRRYNCNESDAYKILPMLDVEELQVLKPCSVLDMGRYPLPQHIHQRKIVYISEQDETLNQRELLKDTYEIAPS